MVEGGDLLLVRPVLAEQFDDQGRAAPHVSVDWQFGVLRPSLASQMASGSGCLIAARY